MLRFLIFTTLLVGLPLKLVAADMPADADLNAAEAQISDALSKAERLSVDVDFLSQIRQDQQKVQSLITGQNTQLRLDELPAINPDTLNKMQQDLARLLENPQEKQQMAQIQQQSGTWPDGPLVLVSFSMPESQLGALAISTHQAGGVLVLRGLVEDDWQKTVQALTRLARYTEAEGVSDFPVVIDPTVFQRFDVVQVPGVLVPSAPLQACTSFPCASSDHALVYGSASLEYALGVIEREAVSPMIRKQAAEYRYRLR